MRELETRLAERKYAIYKPMLELLHGMLTGEVSIDRLSPEEQAGYKKMSTDFGTWVTVFGSDEAVVAYQRWTQATIRQPPAPPPVMFRAWGDLVLAARRDMGYPETEVTVSDVMGIRLLDLYASEMGRAAQLATLDAVAAATKWAPPWQREPAAGREWFGLRLWRKFEKLRGQS